MLKKLPTASVEKGMYVQGVEGSWLGHTLWKTHFVIENDEQLQRVLGCGATEIWIDVSKGVDLRPAAADGTGATTLVEAVTLQEIAKPCSTSLDEELRTAAGLRERSRALITSLYQEARLGNSIDAERCAPLVNDVVESVDRNADALVSLSRLKLSDEYTYMHSVTVCALMVSLGRQLGFDDAQCREAGLAGLLHDLGKAAMPLELIQRPGKLTDEEFEVIRQHPQRGHEMLARGGMTNESVLDVCLHHHERMDGHGYPDKLPAERLSRLTRMGAICDVYDAITSNRPYKAGWDPAESIARMASWKGHFDEDILKAFIRSIGIYPTGSLVRLASGRLAIVVEQNRTRLTAPKVKVFFSTRSNMPLKPELLDLLEAEGRDRIERRESPGDWQFEYLNELWAGDLPIARTLDSRTQYRRPG